MKVSEATLDMLLDMSGFLVAKEDVLMLDKKSEDDISVSRNTEKRIYHSIGKMKKNR